MLKERLLARNCSIIEPSANGYHENMTLQIVRPDPLQILTSTKPLVEASRHVSLDHRVIAVLAERFSGLSSETQAWGDDLHFADGTWRTAAWVFALDALNFCFWSEDAERRWRITYNGERHDGYWALVAALRRAVDEGYPLWDASFLRDLDFHTVAHLLRPTDKEDPAIPLLERRWLNLTELGHGLLSFHDKLGDNDSLTPIEAFIGAAGGSAVVLVGLVAHWFTSFDDAVERNGVKVRFLKRAQILAADLSAAYSGKGLGAFSDLHELTAFADYKVPQVLRRLGVLHYDDELAAIVDSRTLISAGSRYELEIRAATIWAVELLRQRLAANGTSMAAYEIDWALWQAGQTSDAADRPYHRTLTMYY